MYVINESSKRNRGTEALLYQLAANALGLNSNEWEAIAGSKIDSDLQASSEHFRREILTDLQQIHTLKDAEGLADKVRLPTSNISERHRGRICSYLKRPTR